MKTVGVSKCIYDLIKVLEELENDLEFTVFYPFSRILESHHFCPAFTFEDCYYEIQYDNEDCLQVLDFGQKGYKEVGDVLTEEEIQELTASLALSVVGFPNSEEEFKNLVIFGNTHPFINPDDYSFTKTELLDVKTIIERYNLSEKEIENLNRLRDENN